MLFFLDRGMHYRLGMTPTNLWQEELGDNIAQSSAILY